MKSKIQNIIFIVVAIVILNGCEMGESENSVVPQPVPESPAQTEPPSTTEPPPKVITEYTKDIADVASRSSCAQVSWTDRGRAPVAYIKGMALSYVRSLCRIMANPLKPAASLLKAASSGNATKDVLAYYQDILANIGISIAEAGSEPLQATYTIGIGLGMRESSGKYCEGWDVAAGSNRSSDEAEAGLFQASYNSMSASTELRKLYDEYRANPGRCLLEVFKENVTCKSQSILGTGAGADYQEFVTKCPAFAAEYTMALIRILRSHFGPLNRRTAQAVPACDNMLEQVRRLVEQNPAQACGELF